MELVLDLRKTARQNLSGLYERIRTLRQKKTGLLAALAQTRTELEQAQSESQIVQEPKTGTRGNAKSKPGWFSPYLSFLTSGGRRVAAGRNARQNDELYAKHLAPGDLFFHADIQGAPTVILKDGQAASEAEKKEAAQFAASFSSAWKVGAAAVDVYALKPDQVGKTSPTGGYAGRGAFFLSGERQWFRTTPLALKIGVRAGQLAVQPALHPGGLERPALLSPGPVEKEAAAKTLSARLSQKADDIASRLPAGKFSIPS